jgi:hypothetical protein
VSKTVRCSRCKRKARGHNWGDWNVAYSNGYVVGYLCPRCQTPEETREAVENLVRYDYSTLKVLPDGRKVMKERSYN